MAENSINVIEIELVVNSLGLFPSSFLLVRKYVFLTSDIIPVRSFHMTRKQVIVRWFSAAYLSRGLS